MLNNQRLGNLWTFYLSLPPLYNNIIETEAKGTPDILDFSEVRQRLQTALSDFVSPAHAGTLCFWGEESTYDHVEIDYGQGVRLKTKGDSPFLGESDR